VVVVVGFGDPSDSEQIWISVSVSGIPPASSTLILKMSAPVSTNSCPPMG